MKCACLRTVKASIGTIAIFTRSSDGISVHCNSHGFHNHSQGVRSVGRATPVSCYCSTNTPGTVDRLSSLRNEPCCQNFENCNGADGSFQHVPMEAFSTARASHFFHTAVNCARTFLMQNCMTLKMNRFLYILKGPPQTQK